MPVRRVLHGGQAAVAPHPDLLRDPVQLPQVRPHLPHNLPRTRQERCRQSPLLRKAPVPGRPPVTAWEGCSRLRQCRHHPL